MRQIVRIKFGSHLYGTATPASDLDYKAVYVPDAHAILLQRVKGSLSAKRPKAEGEKNVAGEIDEESYSLQRYLGLAAEGQTVALDVLFAPRWSMVDEPGWEWREIERNRQRLITRRSAAFIGYCLIARRIERGRAQAGEARRAETRLRGSVHEHATPQRGDAP